MPDLTDTDRLRRMSALIETLMKRLAYGLSKDVRTDAERIKQLCLLLAKPRGERGVN